MTSTLEINPQTIHFRRFLSLVFLSVAVEKNHPPVTVEKSCVSHLLIARCCSKQNTSITSGSHIIVNGYNTCLTCQNCHSCHNNCHTILGFSDLHSLCPTLRNRASASETCRMKNDNLYSLLSLHKFMNFNNWFLNSLICDQASLFSKKTS